MTHEEQALADDRMRAEIANVIAQTAKLMAEVDEKKRTEVDDTLRAEIANVLAQTSKLNAETAKISRERFMLPVTVYTAALVGAATLLARVWGM